MKILAILLSLVSIQAFASDWKIQYMDYQTDVPLVNRIVQIRTGYLKANPAVPFKGNLIYLEGLADSMLNHDPLLTKIADAGYRVISFDYMGQGGSEGSMNHSRIIDLVYPSLNIQSIAKKVLDLHRRNDNSNLVALGWSTGGLAAYRLANEEKVNAVILIAPGICPNTSVGEGLFRGNKITLKTLTRGAGRYLKDPHVDPIKPNSPLLVPMFASNLIFSSKVAQTWKISNRVKGLVLNSGKKDTYVNNICNRRVLMNKAPHFETITYHKALHEIDNEKERTARKLRADVLQFLNKL